jgi:hypothetical protein
VLLAGSGIATAGFMFWLVAGGLRDGHLIRFLPQIIALMAVTVVLLTFGVFAFLSEDRAIVEDDTHGAKPDYRHTYALFGAIGGALVLALVVRQAVVPNSFGQFGFYRGDAAAEARQKPPRHVGQVTCIECHPDVGDAHDKDLHATVPCETCHGTGYKHAEAGGAEPMLKPTRGQEFRKLCLTCHMRQAARPADFAQIDWKEHVKAVGARDEKVDCKSCHDPHEPLYLSGDIRTSLRHPMVQRLFEGDPAHEDIRASMSAGVKPSDCAFCHQTLVTDFAKRTHRVQRCTNCHAFVKETETYGRMVKNLDSHLCLRCHSGGPHRATDAPAPGILWPDHATSKGADEMKARCLDCHREQVHGPRIERGTKHANG